MRCWIRTRRLQRYGSEERPGTIFHKVTGLNPKIACFCDSVTKTARILWMQPLCFQVAAIMQVHRKQDVFSAEWIPKQFQTEHGGQSYASNSSSQENQKPL
jgi:hypothetical protein